VVLPIETGLQAGTFVRERATHAPLRVCADPDNMPYSRRLEAAPGLTATHSASGRTRERGFEIEIAELLARDLGTTAEYVWWPQRLGFLRNTLNAGSCDVVIGLPTAVDVVLPTRPYYRSTYVFVSRDADRLDVREYGDARLRRLRIGVQLVGDDGSNPPPAEALSRRGLLSNLVGFPVYGDHANGRESKIVDAVARGEVDVAAVWGPIAGYFASRAAVKLRLTPVSASDTTASPHTFDMGMAVRKRDTARRDRLNQFLDQHRAAIADVLDKYAVPRRLVDQ
jgi:mxaJ protein